MKRVSLVLLLVAMPLTMSIAASSPDTASTIVTADTTIPKNVTETSIKTFIEQIDVYGKVAKPQTVFIVPGTDPRVEGIKIERRFFGDIFRRVEKSTLKKEWIRDQKRRDHLLW